MDLVLQFQFSDYRDLSTPLKDVARPCAQLARRMDGMLPEGADKIAGLRKLLEAKECFVRAMRKKRPSLNTTAKQKMP